jgi:hypothetical protein
MSLQISKSAIMSKTLQFLTAGGLTLAIAVWQEVAKPVTDWGLVATMVAGIFVGIGGGAYGRIVAQGPVTSVVSTPAGK